MLTEFIFYYVDTVICDGQTAKQCNIQNLPLNTYCALAGFWYDMTGQFNFNATMGMLCLSSFTKLEDTVASRWNTTASSQLAVAMQTTARIG